MVALSADEAYRKAYENYLAGRFAHAGETCRKVLAVDPEHAHAAYLLAVIAHRQGDYAEGDRMLARAAARIPYSIRLSHPPPVAPRFVEAPNPQWAALFAPHAGRYRQVLHSFQRWLPWLAKIPAATADERTPCWNNIWIPPLDGIAIYCMIAGKRPRRYVEVGSGISTRFAHRAIADHQLDTQIISIDPNPRAGIDALCDQVIRKPLEESDLSLFATLNADDVLFVDNSHHCFPNSDATVFFTEILPALARGVTVGIHDIFLPYDYPAAWEDKYLSEQYLLACYLLSGSPRFEVTLPAFFAAKEPELGASLAKLAAALPGIQLEGWSFWLEMT